MAQVLTVKLEDLFQWRSDYAHASSAMLKRAAPMSPYESLVACSQHSIDIIKRPLCELPLNAFNYRVQSWSFVGTGVPSNRTILAFAQPAPMGRERIQTGSLLMTSMLFGSSSNA